MYPSYWVHKLNAYVWLPYVYTSLSMIYNVHTYFFSLPSKHKTELISSKFFHDAAEFFIYVNDVFVSIYFRLTCLCISAGNLRLKYATEFDLSYNHQTRIGRCRLK